MILKPEKNPSLPGSYRPISLLPVIGKLLEGIMASRLVNYMVKHELFNKYQCGFKSKKSCFHQLLRLSEHVTKWFNKKPSGRTVAIFIDAEKAFDSVWHFGLKKLFHEANFPIKITRWLSSFLDNRKGTVKVNNIILKEFLLMAGVTQGSLLAPF